MAGSSIFGSCVKAINAAFESIKTSLRASFGHLLITLTFGNRLAEAKYPRGSIIVILKFKCFANSQKY